jgi:zinc protease
MPPAGPARPFHFPAVETRTLANGIRVFVVSDHREPSVTVALLLPRAGALHDPSGQAGVAQFTANLLTQGTATRNAGQIAQAIDFVGGSLSAFADHDDTTVVASVMKKDFGVGMDLLADVVLHPNFPKEELERQRQKALSSFRVEYADAGYLASAAFSRLVYGASPYGLPAEGTPKSIAGITREDLDHFYRSHYVPAGALLAFAGDVTPQEAFAAARKYFGSWSSPAKAATAPPPASAPPNGLHFLVIDKPDAVQTQVRIGRTGVKRDSPDYIPLLVTNRIFGGGYNSLLNTAVRIRKGLTYGAGSAFHSRRFGGSFVAATSTRTDKTVAAVQLILDLVGRMAAGQVNQANLHFARDYLTGVFPIQTETPTQVVTRVLTAVEYGLPADYNQTYPQRVAAVTLAQVKQMGQRYFVAKDLDIVLVGNASGFRDALKKAFPHAAYEEISVDQLDLLLPKLHHVTPKPPAPTPATLARGKTALETAVQAAGGSALAAVKTIRVVGSGRLISERGAIPIEENYEVAYPNRIHSRLNIMGQKLTQVFDGQKGWLASTRKVEPLPPDLIENLRRRILLTEGIGIFQAALAGESHAQWLGEQQVQGRKLVAVEWQTDLGPVKLYIDPATHLVTGAEYTSKTSSGTADTLELWGDFRPTAGLHLPFHMTAYQNGTQFMDVTIKEVQVNVTVAPKLFAKPQPVSAPAPASHP